MATMKERDGEEMNLRATNIANYIGEIDTIREKEFPMLQGTFPRV